MFPAKHPLNKLIEPQLPPRIKFNLQLFPHHHLKHLLHILILLSLVNYQVLLSIVTLRSGRHDKSIDELIDMLLVTLASYEVDGELF